MSGRVFLGGGGSATDEALLWDELFAAGGHFLYWPFALPASRHADARAWLTGALSPYAGVDLTVWSELAARDPGELAAYDLLFVGGGNTFTLLDHVRRHGFVEPLRAFVAGGGRMYGGSAGAVLAGVDIAVAAYADANDVGLTETAGLGLVGDLAVSPHHEERLEPMLRAWSAEHARPVLALPERGGAVVDGGTVRAVGPADVRLLDPDSATNLAPGATHPLD